MLFRISKKKLQKHSIFTYSPRTEFSRIQSNIRSVYDNDTPSPEDECYPRVNNEVVSVWSADEKNSRVNEHDLSVCLISPKNIKQWHSSQLLQFTFGHCYRRVVILFAHSVHASCKLTHIIISVIFTHICQVPCEWNRKRSNRSDLEFSLESSLRDTLPKIVFVEQCRCWRAVRNERDEFYVVEKSFARRAPIQREKDLTHST